MKFNTTALIPLVSKLGKFLQAGFEHYIAMKAMGMDPSAEALAAFLEDQMDDWNPSVRGSKLLDPETKAACARFLGGVAFNMAIAQAKKAA